MALPCSRGTPSFQIHETAASHKGRLGTLETSHGSVQTPAFLFCATKGALKGISPWDIRQAGLQILLSNTYHLMVNPGGEWLEKMGGLHKVMGWSGPLFTDSGGYQIFSLGHGSVSQEIKGVRRNEDQQLRSIKEEGAVFLSYRDGSRILLTPEKSIKIQSQIGADLICVLDECTPFHETKGYTQRSMELSHRWALRSLKAFQKEKKDYQGLYGIVQGGVYEDLRRTSADFINQQDFFGHAIGGSLGAHKDQMYQVVAYTQSLLTPQRPVHLLGIGGLRDILFGVSQGIDTFDCVHPTRLGRHGGALVKACYWRQGTNPGSPKEHINLHHTLFKNDSDPIDPTCPCPTCQSYSRGYLRYLLKAKEMTALSAITLHNIYFMDRFMRDIRQRLQDLTSLAEDWLPPND